MLSPYGTEITPERLTQVARCERVLRDLGFRVFRVRHHDTVARIEVAPEELQRLLVPEVREEVYERFGAAGFSYVAVDLRGYRPGSLNESPQGARPPERGSSGRPAFGAPLPPHHP